MCRHIFIDDINVPRAAHNVFFVNGELTVVGGHTSGFVMTPTAEYFSDGAWHLIPSVYHHDDGMTWEYYRHCMGSRETLTKYNQGEQVGYQGYTDDLTELEPMDDAATVNWGDGHYATIWTKSLYAGINAWKFTQGGDTYGIDWTWRCGGIRVRPVRK